METLTIVRPPGKPRPLLCETPDRATPKPVLVLPGHVAQVDRTSPENQAAPADWIHIVLSNQDEETPGWIEVTYLGAAFAPVATPFALDRFVRACCQAELTARDRVATTRGPPVVLADYLIALALLETGLERFDNQISGTDAIGPFQFTADEWNELAQAAPDLALKPADRLIPLAQVAAAEVATQRDWAALVELAEERVAGAGTVQGDEYVPSLLNLFHARMVGPVAADILNQVNADAVRKNDDLAIVLRGAVPDADALLARRARFLVSGPAAAPLSVNGFFLSTSSKLDEKLTRAYSLFREFFEAFTDPPSRGAAPWLDFAEQEMARWTSSEFTETNPAGAARIVNDYFHATDYHPAQVEHWCGAFVAWCLKNCGDPDIAASVVREAQRAAAWKDWGNVEVRTGNLRTLTDERLRGAIVVLHPEPGTSSSGHVTFAVGRPVQADKIECIGGNQSDTVRKSSYSIDKIASVRWLEFSPPQSTPTAPVQVARPGDVFAPFYCSRGRAYRTVVGHSFYNAPLVQGGVRGRTRIWGDADIATQQASILALLSAAKALAMTKEQQAMALAIASVESGYNPDAAAGTSSASGLGQFIKATGESYGLNDGNRWDLQAQASALASHTRDNCAAAAAAGRDESWVYARHHDGSFTNSHRGHDLSLEKVMPRYRELLPVVTGLAN